MDLQQLVAYRRELHEHPELSFHEYDTTKRLTAWLKEAGIRIVDFGLKTGVVAEVSGTKKGR